MSRVYNFSAGPAVLPLEVLQEAQQNLVDYKGSGMSVMEMSHRGKEYDAIHQEAIATFKELCGLDDDWSVCFIQCRSLQFFLCFNTHLLLSSPFYLLFPDHTAVFN